MQGLKELRVTGSAHFGTHILLQNSRQSGLFSPLKLTLGTVSDFIF